MQLSTKEKWHLLPSSLQPPCKHQDAHCAAYLDCGWLSIHFHNCLVARIWRSSVDHHLHHQRLATIHNPTWKATGELNLLTPSLQMLEPLENLLCCTSSIEWFQYWWHQSRKHTRI